MAHRRFTVVYGLPGRERASERRGAGGTNYHTEGDTLPSKLLEYLDRAAGLDAEFIVFDDGYRGWTYRYADVAQMANALRLFRRAKRPMRTVRSPLANSENIKPGGRRAPATISSTRPTR